MLSESIDKLLRYKEGLAEDTNKFQFLKHNKDLCPMFEKQLNEILNCYGKYQKIAYDIQGIRDNGIDVVVRFESYIGEKYIGFQIKSFDDLKKRDYLADLKNQYFDAKAYYRDTLVKYYIALCTDVKKHLNKIRQIKAAFTTYSDAIIIDPTYCLMFMKFSQMRINAVLESYLKEGDVVFNDALQTINNSSPTEIALLFAIIIEEIFSSTRTVPLGEIYSNNALQQLYDSIPDFERDYYFIDEDEYFDQDEEPYEHFDQARTFNERVLEDLQALEGVFITLYEQPEMIELDKKMVFSIEALLLEAYVRYGYNSNELLLYLYDILEVKKRFKIEEEL